jgi:hypothetical protein
LGALASSAAAQDLPTSWLDRRSRAGFRDVAGPCGNWTHLTNPLSVTFTP